MRTLKLIIAALATTVLGASAMAAGETVLVAGATGKSGGPLVKILQSQGYKVRALVRDKARATELGAGVEIAEGDVTNPETLTPAMKGVSYVISTIGASKAAPPNNPENVDYKGVANLADAAKAMKVKHFVLMSSGGAGDANPATPLNRMFGMVLLWKGKGEDHLRQSGVPYTIVRPGGLLNCEPGKVGLKISTRDDNTRGAICRADVGLVMADALTNPDAGGRTVVVVTDKELPVDGWKKTWAAIPKD